MKLFTVGPVEMYPETLKLDSKQIPYFRTTEFSSLMIQNEELLKKITNAPDGSNVIFLTCSGTGAMEATIINSFSKTDKLLIINGGGFGYRFCQICDCHNIHYDSIDLQFGEILTEEHLKSFENNQYKGLLVNADETSTGQLYDLKMLSDFCKMKNMIFIVDAISSFLADPIDFNEYQIDALIVSSQKALALEPGLSIVIVSERLCDLIKNKSNSFFYFDFKRYFKDMERGQTPFTPAVRALLELNQMLISVDEMSINVKIQKTNEMANYFRTKLVEIPINIPDYPLSNALTPLLFKNGAMDIYNELKEKYGFVVTPSSGDFKETMLRVSHMGNLKKEDYDQLIDSLREIIVSNQQ